MHIRTTNHPRPDQARRFLKIIIRQARRATLGKPNRGCLQICTLTGDEEVFRYRKFGFGETEELIEHALRQGELGKNTYVETRTVRRDAKWRGKLEETCWVFGLVIDSDADRQLGWKGDASLIVETSPDNRQYWFLA